VADFFVNRQYYVAHWSLVWSLPIFTVTTVALL